MSQLTYLGTEWTSPDHTAGYGTSYSPATILPAMILGKLYYKENGETDVLFVSGGDEFIISLYKSFQNQKLLQQFVVRTTSVGGSPKLRWIHRSLATCFTFEEALRAVGVDVIVPDAWGTTAEIIAANTALASLWIQVYKA